VHDPARIRVKLVVLGNTREAHRLGYEVRDGRLVAFHLPQVPTQQAQAAAKQRRERWRVAAQAEAASAREAADRSAVLTREAQRRAEVAEQKVKWTPWRRPATATIRFLSLPWILLGLRPPRHQPWVSR
jgi:hypothetical protein